MVHHGHFLRRGGRQRGTGTMSYMTMRSTPLVLWQYICNEALWDYALMAFVLLCVISGVHGFPISPAVGKSMPKPGLSVLAKAVDAGTPEPSGSSSVFNRESLRRSRLERKKRKVQERKNKKCSGKIGCKDCPFGGSGCIGDEDQCIYRFPNQNYEKKGPKKVD